MKNLSLWKYLLIMFLVVFLIIGGSAWYIYAHRGQIAEKIVDYTVQKITGVNGAVQDSWVASLMDSSSKDIKTALLDMIQNSDNQENGQKRKRRPGLATMAEMFANGTGGSDGLDLEQMTQAVISSLGGQTDKTAKNGHDINDRDEKGRTLLMNICRLDASAEIVEQVLRYGSDINATDNDGRTALMYAAAYDCEPEVVMLLLKKGALPQALDNNGNSALSYAKSDEIRSLLK